MHSNINILRSLRSACYYFYYWREISPCFDFFVVTHSDSSRPFLCALAACNYSNTKSCEESICPCLVLIDLLWGAWTVGLVIRGLYAITCLNTDG